MIIGKNSFKINKGSRGMKCMIMTEVLILLINSFDRRVDIYQRMRVFYRSCSLHILNLQRTGLRSRLQAVILYTDEFILFVHYRSH